MSVGERLYSKLIRVYLLFTYSVQIVCQLAVTNVKFSIRSSFGACLHVNFWLWFFHQEFAAAQRIPTSILRYRFNVLPFLMAFSWVLRGSFNSGIICAWTNSMNHVDTLKIAVYTENIGDYEKVRTQDAPSVPFILEIHRPWTNTNMLLHFSAKWMDNHRVPRHAARN